MDFKSNLLAALAASVVLGATACQTGRQANVAPPKQAYAPALAASVKPVPASNDKSRQFEAAQAAPKTDPIATLIANVEQQFQSGKDSFQADEAEEARQHFDQALDLLASTPLDIHSDARLEREFNRVLQGLNDFEQEEQTQAQADDQTDSDDNSSAQQSEPAPIDEANEANTPVDANVKAKATAEVKATHSDLPLMMTDPVASYINYFSGRGRETLERALARSGRYEP